jgi:hypothetical protein
MDLPNSHRHGVAKCDGRGVMRCLALIDERARDQYLRSFDDTGGYWLRTIAEFGAIAESRALRPVRSQPEAAILQTTRMACPSGTVGL